LVQSAAQLFSGSISDFDLDTILMQVYPEVNTRKLLLVGHSQGAFYTNEMYTYLAAHGEPTDALGVYNVASPATVTMGNGKYLNSSGDTVLNELRALHIAMLPNNIDLVPSSAGDLSGHGFITDYLANAGMRMQSDIDAELLALKPDLASAQGDCFDPPQESLGYEAQAAAFAVADPTATVLKVGTVTAVDASLAALATTAKVAAGAVQLVADAIHVTATPPSQAQTDAKTLQIVDKLYGSSVNGLSAQDQKDLLGSSQGSAVALAAVPQKTPAPSGVVLGTSTIAATTTPATPNSIFPSSSNGIVWGSGGSPTIQPQVQASAEVPAPAPVVDDTDADASSTVADTDVSTTTPDIASSTDPIADDTASTTEQDAASSTPADTQSYATPFTDSFDTYDGSAWTVPPTALGVEIPFTASDGSQSECHSGACIIGNGGVGNLMGGLPHEAFMYKETGVGQESGAFTVWAKARIGVDAPDGSFNICDVASVNCTDYKTIQFSNVIPDDDIWHQYALLWRQGSTTVESCLLTDDTNISDCAWNPTTIALGTEFDGIGLDAFSPHPELGDNVWIDDLAALPNQ